MAHERPGIFRHISEHVQGIAFIGVPHRGSHVARWGSLFANLLSYASLKFSTITAVVVDLKHSSKTLMEISSQFVERGNGLIILSFYEALPMRGFTDPVCSRPPASRCARTDPTDR